MTGPIVTVAPSSGVRVSIVAPSSAPTYKLAVTTQGPPGPPGAPGASGSGYDFTQVTPADVWTIAHNLGYRPSVAVSTVGGVEVEGGEVLHLSANVLTVTFDVAFAGTARCS